MHRSNLTPHINLVCGVCHTIIDLDCELPVSPGEIMTAVKFDTSDWRMEYRGRGADCRRRQGE